MKDEYAFYIYTPRELSERALFEKMLEKGIARDFPATRDNIDRITAAVLRGRAPNDYLTLNGKSIDGQMPLSELEKNRDGSPRMGYYVSLDASMRREIALAARELGIAPRPSRAQAVEDNASMQPGISTPGTTGGRTEDPRAGWSQEYRDRTDAAQKQALDIQAKFQAMDEFYRAKNERHGLGTYVHAYLSTASTNAAEVGRLVEDANSGVDTAKKLEAINTKYGQTLNEIIGPDHRTKTPADVRNFLDASYKGQFETWTSYAEWIGTIPTPATRGIEFGTKLLMNSLKLYSGDISASDMALYTVGDGAKFFTGNYGDRISKLDGGATLKVVTDTAGNIVTNIADARRKLAENPGMDADTVYRTAIGKAFTDSFTGALGDNVKLLDKYGAGPEAIKTFGLGMGKNFMGEMLDVQKQAATTPGADTTQLLKEAAARALVKTFAEGVTKAGKTAMDEDTTKALIDTAGKLGLQEPVKQLLKQQQTLAVPDATKPAPASVAPLQPQAAIPAGVTGSENFRSLMASAEKLKLPADVPPVNVALKASDVASRENVNASVVVQGTRDPNALTALDPALNLRTSTFTVADVRQMDANATVAALDQRTLSQQQEAAAAERSARAQG